MKGGGKACQRQKFKSRTWQSFDFHFSEDLLLDRKKQLEVVRMGRRGAFEVLHVLWGIKNNCPCLKDWLFTVTETQRWKQFNAHLSCCVCVCVQATSAVSALSDLMDCSPPDSSVHGILRARILERVAIPFSGGSSQLRDQISISYVSWLGRWTLYH